MKTPFSLAFATIAVYFAASATAATDVTWTGMPLTASSTSIRTDGTLKYAYARGNYTANGVAFSSQASEGGISNPNCSVNITHGSGAGSLPGDVETGGYKDLLSSGWYASAATRQVTLKNLAVGKKYLLQIVAFRSDYKTTHKATAPDGQTYIKFAGTGWEYGGSLVAEFTADTTEETFSVVYANQSWINGIQVRELPADGPVSSRGFYFICK